MRAKRARQIKRMANAVAPHLEKNVVENKWVLGEGYKDILTGTVPYTPKALARRMRRRHKKTWLTKL